MTFECPTCEKSSPTESGMKKHHYFSHGESIAGEKYECPNCEKTFRAKPSRSEYAEIVYCSIECKGRYERDGEYINCSNCGDKTYVQPYDLKQYDKHFCSEECSFSMRDGENNNNWSGGSDMFFHRPAGRAWRKAVFERDEYTCQDCGSDDGGNLNAHHLKRRSECNNFEKCAIWNGVTLCKNCHAERHKGEGVYELIKANSQSSKNFSD